jgi:hypothetical protein
MPASPSRLSACVAALLALGIALAAAAPGEGSATPGALLARGPDDLIAVSRVGARNVVVLRAQPPSIVRVREVFLAPGETVVAVAWSQSGRDVEITTSHTRFVVSMRPGDRAPIGWQATPLPAAGSGDELARS